MFSQWNYSFILEKRFYLHHINWIPAYEHIRQTSRLRLNLDLDRFWLQWSQQTCFPTGLLAKVSKNLFNQYRLIPVSQQIKMCDTWWINLTLQQTYMSLKCVYCIGQTDVGIEKSLPSLLSENEPMICSVQHLVSTHLIDFMSLHLQNNILWLNYCQGFVRVERERKKYVRRKAISVMQAYSGRAAESSSASKCQ